MINTLNEKQLPVIHTIMSLGFKGKHKEQKHALRAFVNNYDNLFTDEQINQIIDYYDWKIE